MNGAKKLNVPLLPQQTPMWCWAASGQMVMNFLGNASVTQCAEACDYFNRTDCCASPTPQECVNGGWPQFDHYGFACACTSDAALTWDQLRAEIDAGRPVAFSKHWTSGGGHMMVAIGYEVSDDQRLVYINDPWPPNTGDARVITYEAYVSGNGYYHWNDYYNIRPAAAAAGAQLLGGIAMPAMQDFDAAARPIAQKALATALRVVGHDAPGAAEAGSLGDPLPVVMLGPNHLLQATPGDGCDAAWATETTSVIYPVHMDDKVVSAVSLEEQDGEWKTTAFGHGVVAGLLADARAQHSRDSGTSPEAYFMVDALPLGFQGLAAKSAEGLTIVPLIDDESAGFKAGVALPAEKVLSVLTDRARKLNRAPA